MLSAESFKTSFENSLTDYFQKRFAKNDGYEKLIQSMSYSLTNGGKRFRPYLCYLVGQLFGADYRKTISAGLAVEMIHTYSLIHDDLPCMDNDDFRRGQPTNHKVYGEDLALLAGDALLTESFYVLSSSADLTDSQKIHLVRLYADYSGSHGMVGGQVIDMQMQPQSSNADLEKMHHLKTGRLIQTAALAGYISAQPEMNPKDYELVEKFAAVLGTAFQVQDDLLDFTTEKIDQKNLARRQGVEKTKEILNHLTDQALNLLQQINRSEDFKKPLIQLLEMNRGRGH